MIIGEKYNLREPQAVYVRKGRNQGKVIGYVHFPLNKENYFYVEKYYNRKQIMIKPEYQGYQYLSITAVEDLKKLRCNKVIYRLIGYENKSFLVAFTLSEIEKGRIVKWDDSQYQFDWKSKPRIYNEQVNLKEIGVGIE